MAQVTVTAQYVADTSAYVRNVRAATEATNQLAAELPQVERAQDRVKTSSIALGSAMGVLGAQVFARATSAVMRYAQQGIAAAKDYEQTVISIEGIFAGTGMAMEDAAEKTQSYLAELRDFAAKTPFELPQTLDAVKRLLSIGYAADDVKDRMLPAIGDIVAALGQPPHAISAVVYAFGQMKSAGRVLSQDLMQIGNALPGFNAKMALANELFQGDFGALTKAMESGSLDSSKAIDVLITAMTKFGGAAGAMDRQSKTLAGTLSTFNDTVNNALIDGLLPSLPALSAALNEVMPAVAALATSFAGALGPALIEGAALLGEFAPVASEIIPPLIDVASQMTGLSKILMSLSPVIVAAAEAIGTLADFLNMLPTPIYAAVAGLLVARIAMKKLQIDSAAAATGVGAAALRIKVAIVGMTDTIRLSVMLAGVSFKAFGLAARQMATTFAASMRVIAGAAKGMMAALGPVGWAIIGVSVAFEVLAGKSAAAEELVANLKSTVDETTNAFTELTATAMGTQFRLDLSPEDQAALAEMGLSIDSMTAAAMKGGPAVEELNAKIQGMIDSSSVGDFFGGKRDLLITTQRNFQGMADAAAEAQRQLDAEAQAADAAARATANTAWAAWSAADAYTNVANTSYSAADAYAGMTSTASTYSAASKEAYLQTKSLELATKAGVAAVKALDAATKKLSETLSNEASYDNAREGILKLSKELKEGDKTIKGYSQAALDNRAAIRDAAQGYIDYANSLQDPIARQKALEEGQRRVAKALREAGIDPKNSDVIKAFKEQAKESKTTVDEFAAQRKVAKKYGNEVGTNFIDGIVEILESEKSQVGDSAAAAAAVMPVSANAAIGAQSPSRAAMKVAKNFIDGIVVGVKAERALAEKEISDFGQALLDRLSERFSQFGVLVEQAGSAFEAMREATRQPFGEASNITQAFGADGDIGSAISTFDQLAASIRDAYAPLMDAEIVGAKAAKSARKQMRKELQALEAETANAIDAMRRRQAALDAMAVEQQKASAKIDEINSRYDKFDKAASDAVKAIQSKWDKTIPALEKALKDANTAFDRENQVLNRLINERDSFLERISSGLRSFANDLSSVTKKTIKTVQDLGNGLTITTETEVADASSFRANLESRLDSIRAFANNVRALIARGLDPVLVQEFVAAGVGSAGDTVAALAGAADSEIAAINSAQSALNAEIASFQQTASAQWFDVGIAQQEAVVAPLRAAAEAAQRALDQANASRASELAAAEAHAENLRLLRQQEISQAEADRDAELLRLQGIVDAIQNTELPARAAAIQAIFTTLQTTLPKQTKAIGKEAINGIIAGLNAREPALLARAREIANAIKTTMQDALRVSSPSRVTRTIGEQIADGLIMGMKSSERAVAAAADSLANQVVVPISAPSLGSISAAPATGFGAMAGGGYVTIHNKYEVTVQSLSGDKRQIGREVVEAIKAFERSSGPVYQPASI